MRYLKTFLLLQIFCLSAVYNGFSQSTDNIVQLNAYVQESTRGNIQVDEKGKPLTGGVIVTHQLYVQTKGKTLPQWGTYYTRSGVFTIQAEEITTPSITVGKRKNGDSMRLSVKRGNRLWKLNLIPTEMKVPANINSILKKNAAVFSAKFTGKQFMHTIAKEIELETIFYP